MPHTSVTEIELKDDDGIVLTIEVFGFDAGTRVEISGSATLIYQHEARGADKIITDNIDAHVQAEQDRRDEDDGPAEVPAS
jgi:hypothetical protein